MCDFFSRLSECTSHLASTPQIRIFRILGIFRIIVRLNHRLPRIARMTRILRGDLVGVCLNRGLPRITRMARIYVLLSAVIVSNQKCSEGILNIQKLLNARTTTVRNICYYSSILVRLKGICWRGHKRKHASFDSILVL